MNRTPSIRTFHTLRPTATIALVVALALCASAGSAQTQRNAPVARAASEQSLPAWEQLSPAQREALMTTFRDRWNQSPQQRARLMNYAERWQKMTPEQRQRAQAGKQRWENMTPQQRAQARAAFERRGQGVPPAQRAALREKLKTMSPEQRRAWMKEHRGQLKGMQRRDGQGQKRGDRANRPQQAPQR